MNSLPLSVLKVCTFFWNLFSMTLSKSMIIFAVWSLCVRLNKKPKLEQLSCITRVNLACDHWASGIIGPIRSACSVQKVCESRSTRFSNAFLSILPMMQDLHMPVRWELVISIPLTELDPANLFSIESPKCPNLGCQVCKSVAKLSLLTVARMLSCDYKTFILTS